MTTDPDKAGSTPELSDDAEAAAVWSRLAPHAKKSFTEVLDDYFAETAEPATGGEDDGRPGGAAPAGGPAGDGGADAGKARPKAQGKEDDLGRQISEFFFGKQRK